jgi:L-serine/L-threonine ammonia-lyase
VRTQTEKPATIVVAVGGGGLLLGVLEGLARNRWADVPVVACETEGMASFAATFRVKSLVTLPTVSGVATSLGARCVSAGLLPWIGKHPLSSVTVTDKEAIDATGDFLDDHRFLVEPACGAALASLYGKKLGRTDHSGPLIVIVCGGAVVSQKKLEEWRRL